VLYKVQPQARRLFKAAGGPKAFCQKYQDSFKFSSDTDCGALHLLHQAAAPRPKQPAPAVPSAKQDVRVKVDSGAWSLGSPFVSPPEDAPPPGQDPTTEVMQLPTEPPGSLTGLPQRPCEPLGRGSDRGPLVRPENQPRSSASPPRDVSPALAPSGTQPGFSAVSAAGASAMGAPSTLGALGGAGIGMASPPGMAGELQWAPQSHPGQLPPQQLAAPALDGTVVMAQRLAAEEALFQRQMDENQRRVEAITRGIPTPVPMPPPATEAAPVPGPMQSVPGPQQAQLKEDDRACVLCISAPKEMVLIPCGHLCLCAPCGQLLQTSHQPCPICRTPFVGIFRVYA